MWSGWSGRRNSADGRQRERAVIDVNVAVCEVAAYRRLPPALLPMARPCRRGPDDWRLSRGVSQGRLPAVMLPFLSEDEVCFGGHAIGGVTKKSANDWKRFRSGIRRDSYRLWARVEDDGPAPFGSRMSCVVLVPLLAIQTDCSQLLKCPRIYQ